MSQTFEGKVALVTGGSPWHRQSATALELARQGADIAFNYLRGQHDAATETQREIEEPGRWHA